MTKIELNQQLLKLRDELKKTAPMQYYKSSRSNRYIAKQASICEDSVIKHLTENPPRSIDEFRAIPGIGEAFISKYADSFFTIIQKYHDRQVNLSHIDSNVYKTLKKLEQRLVNINKRNRLLYTGKLYNKNGVDLYDQDVDKNNDLIRFLLRPTKNSIHKLIDLYRLEFNQDEESTKKIKKLTALMREFSKDFRETGQFDSYVGYPYVIGKMYGDEFNIRAPLLLIPVKLESNNYSIYLKRDLDKDILWNTNLVLTHYKLNKIQGDIPDNVFENEEDFTFDDITDLFSSYGIHIQDRKKPFSKFIDYTQESFPEFKSGEMYIYNSAVIGKFSFYSSFLQKDFKNIIDEGRINENLNILLDNYEGTITTEDINQSRMNQPKAKFSEAEIHYINDLNLSQEQAIIGIKQANQMVIQGPPGTGKSQTITSMIVDFALQGKTILMVSQKKAALDVVYSRLGHLSKHTLLIHDVKDKEFFYHQLKSKYDDFSSMMKNESNPSTMIDSKIKSLYEIGMKLYEKLPIGVSMSQIYQSNRSNRFLLNKINYAQFYNAIQFKPTFEKYDLLIKHKETFADIDNLNRVSRYLERIKTYPWMINLQSGLGITDFQLIQSDIDQYLHLRSQHPKKLTQRIINKFNEIAILKKMNREYLKAPLSWYKMWSFRTEFVTGFKNVEDFIQCKEYYDNLSKPSINYYDHMTIIKNKFNINDNELSETLFDYTIFSYISKFEAENKQALQNIDNFDQLISDINQFINHKKNYTQASFSSYLIDEYKKNIRNSKKSGEFQRLIEKTKGKWNVPRFIQKFTFELFNGNKVWLMTPEAVSEVVPLQPGMFDLLIFDEASQIYVEKAIPAIFRAKKLVIAGDHKQLRPSSLGFGRIDIDDEVLDDEEIEISASLEEDSLLDLARYKFNEYMLNYHYRAQFEELIAFSNHAFYQGRLFISPNTRRPIDSPIQVIKVDNGLWHKRQNTAEAKRVVQLLKHILKNRDGNETIGVITFNSNQRDHVLDLIDEQSKVDQEFEFMMKSEQNRTEHGEDVGLFIKNIENVQGDERDIIIFTTAYAKDEKGKVVRNFGWLNQSGGENRLNVAISRAKKKIYLVTSIEANELDVEGLINDGPRYFKKYLEYAYAVSNRNQESIKTILSSLSEKNDRNYQLYNVDDLVDHVEKKLNEQGYSTERSIGTGKYRVDLAIVDPSTKQYMLGIEFDHVLYDQFYNPREKDIYRVKYLENHGWKTYRIWSNKWWHNPDRELSNITKMIADCKTSNVKSENLEKTYILIERIKKKLAFADIPYDDTIDSITFKLGNETVSITKTGKMTSSFNDIRSLDILSKEIDLEINKKREQRVKELERFRVKEVSNIEPKIDFESKIQGLKKGEIRCTCGNVFFEHLGECPRCGENTVSIMKNNPHAHD